MERTASSRLMPEPSSLTRMLLRPPSSIAMSIVVAPASIAFSTSSLTIEAGRSTTSPAAIWLARSAGSRLILPTLHPAASAGQARGGGEDAGEAMLERKRLVGEMNQPVAHVAKPERHFGADVDDVAADQAVERFSLAIHALHQ